MLTGKNLVGMQNLRDQLLFVCIVFFRRHDTPDFSIYNDLRSGITCRFQKHRIHLHPRSNPRRLGLHDLRSSHLQAVFRDKGIQGHILRFKGRRPVSVLAEHSAKSSCQDTFSGIGHGSLNHDWLCHDVSSFLRSIIRPKARRSLSLSSRPFTAIR